MTIKGLNPFLKKKCPEVFIQLPVISFYGKRIIIDGDYMTKRFMSTAHKDVIYHTDVSIEDPDRSEIVKKWISRWKDFLTSLIRRGITPIIVFDGDHPLAKKKTKEKRKKIYMENKESAESYLQYVRSLDIFERTSSIVAELRKRLSILHYVTREERLLLIEIIKSVGIPFLQARGEGEQLCSMLAREGKVDAVFSTDTDLLVYGTPLIITEDGEFVYNPEKKITEEYFKCVKFDGILQSLDITYNTFIDLCIMAECDYNYNIPGVGIGRSFTLLKKCECIENIPSKYDNEKHLLNVDVCREQFGYISSTDICINDIILNIDINSINNNKTHILLSENDISDWLDILANIYSTFPILPLDNFISKPPEVSKIVLNNIDGSKKILVQPAISSHYTGYSNIPLKINFLSSGSSQINESKPQSFKSTKQLYQDLNIKQYEQIQLKYPNLFISDQLQQDN